MKPPACSISGWQNQQRIRKNLWNTQKMFFKALNHSNYVEFYSANLPLQDWNITDITYIQCSAKSFSDTRQNTNIFFKNTKHDIKCVDDKTNLKIVVSLLHIFHPHRKPKQRQHKNKRFKLKANKLNTKAHWRKIDPAPK